MSGPPARRAARVSARPPISCPRPRNLTPPPPRVRRKIIKICSRNPSSFPCYYDFNVIMGLASIETEYDCGAYTAPPTDTHTLLVPLKAGHAYSFRSDHPHYVDMIQSQHFYDFPGNVSGLVRYGIVNQPPSLPPSPPPHIPPRTRNSQVSQWRVNNSRGDLSKTRLRLDYDANDRVATAARE